MSTRTAAVIGAGQAGATLAVGLLDAGFDVTIYSDREQESLRNDVPATGTALIYGSAIDAERSLGLDTYETRAPLHKGLHARLRDATGAELLEFDASTGDSFGVAVDTRLKADERLTTFRQRGGRFIVGEVTPVVLDEIAAQHDLTVVSTGRGGLADLFAIDDSRSPYAQPQRHVITVAARGLGHGPDVFAHRAGGTRAAFSVIADQGEGWWGPYLHKDAGPVWSFLGYARPGSDFDRRFSSIDSPSSALRTVQDLYRDYADWDLDEILALEPIEEDPKSWLKGAVRPVVRRGSALTAGGHAIASLGDTSAAWDPISGQGAQSGLLQARRLVEAAATHEGAFDTAWIDARYEAHVRERTDPALRFQRIFLGDPAFAEIGGVLFTAAAVSPVFADAIAALVDDPSPLSTIDSAADALDFVRTVTQSDPTELLAGFEPAGRFTRSDRGRRAVTL